MKIDNKWIEKHNPCGEGIAWAGEHNIIGQDRVTFIKALMKYNKLVWANWLIVRTMTFKQYVAYAVYAAEKVIDIYEKEYPNDKRPRQAIEAAKKCIKSPTAENKKAAYTASYAADTASDVASYAADDAAYAAADAAYAAADAASDVAYAAADAAYAAADAAYAAADAASDAADAASYAAYAAADAASYAADAASYAAYAAADAAMKKEILLYGLKLITTPAGEKGRGV